MAILKYSNGYTQKDAHGTHRLVRMCVLRQLLKRYEKPVTNAMFLEAIDLKNAKVFKELLGHQHLLTTQIINAAVEKNESLIVKQLLEKKCPMDGSTILMAISNKNSKIVNLLVEYNCPMNESTIQNASENNLEIIGLILKNRDEKDSFAAGQKTTLGQKMFGKDGPLSEGEEKQLKDCLYLQSHIVWQTIVMFYYIYPLEQQFLENYSQSVDVLQLKEQISEDDVSKGATDGNEFCRILFENWKGGENKKGEFFELVNPKIKELFGNELNKMYIFHKQIHCLLKIFMHLSFAAKSFFNACGRKKMFTDHDLARYYFVSEGDDDLIERAAREIGFFKNTFSDSLYQKNLLRDEKRLK